MEYCGEFRPVPTSTAENRICEHLPLLADRRTISPWFIGLRTMAAPPVIIMPVTVTTSRDTHPTKHSANKATTAARWRRTGRTWAA